MSQYYTIQTVPGYGLLLALLGCLEPNKALQATAASALFGVGCEMDATPPAGCSLYGVRFQARAKLMGRSRQSPWSVASARTSARCSA
jgi:hypothetical protein